MNFRRGRQMIVHDPRLNWPGNPNATPPVPATPLTPPVAWRRWTVHPMNSIEYILTRVGEVAGQVTDGIDALHFMAHGNRGLVALGRENLDEGNVRHFEQVAGKARFIVFFSCLVGSEHVGSAWMRGTETIGRTIAAITGATVITAQHNQEYHRTPANVIDFGPWEGPVDVYRPGALVTYQADDSPFRAGIRLDLEALVFGA